MEKTININDGLRQTDSLSKGSLASGPKRNCIDVFNSKNQHIFRGYNVVVNTGRQYTLQSVFNHSVDPSLGRGNLPRQWVSVFRVGDGGATLTDPFVNIQSNVDEVDLASPLIFNQQDTTLTHEEGNLSLPHYWSGTSFKDFTNITYGYDVGTTDMFMEITLKLGQSELLGQKVNELGLYLAEHTLDVDGNITNKTNFKLFSKVTFATLPKSPNLNDDWYTFVYRVYA